MARRGNGMLCPLDDQTCVFAPELVLCGTGTLSSPLELVMYLKVESGPTSTGAKALNAISDIGDWCCVRRSADT